MFPVFPLIFSKFPASSPKSGINNWIKLIIETRTPFRDSPIASSSSYHLHPDNPSNFHILPRKYRRKTILTEPLTMLDAVIIRNPTIDDNTIIPASSPRRHPPFTRTSPNSSLTLTGHDENLHPNSKNHPQPP